MTASLAARERSALCDLALDLGPDAPTLCEGWKVKDLILHLVVRDRPWLSIRKPAPLLAEESFEALVSRARRPAKAFAWAPVEKLMNTTEFFIHHEDVRRAQPDWSPRTLASADEALQRQQLGRFGKLIGLKLKVPLIVDDGTTVHTLRRGDHPVTISGDVGELLMYLSGRDAVRDLTFDGPPARIEKLSTVRGL